MNLTLPKEKLSYGSVNLTLQQENLPNVVTPFPDFSGSDDDGDKVHEDENISDNRYIILHLKDFKN